MTQYSILLEASNMLEDTTESRTPTIRKNPTTLSEMVQNQSNYSYLIKGLNTLGRAVVGAGLGATGATTAWGAGYFLVGAWMGFSDNAVPDFLKSAPYTATIGALLGTGIAIYYTIFPEN